MGSGGRPCGRECRVESRRPPVGSFRLPKPLAHQRFRRGVGHGLPPRCPICLSRWEDDRATGGFLRGNFFLKSVFGGGAPSAGGENSLQESGECGPRAGGPGDPPGGGVIGTARVFLEEIFSAAGHPMRGSPSRLDRHIGQRGSPKCVASNLNTSASGFGPAASYRGPHGPGFPWRLSYPTGPHPHRRRRGQGSPRRRRPTGPRRWRPHPTARGHRRP